MTVVVRNPYCRTMARLGRPRESALPSNNRTLLAHDVATLADITVGRLYQMHNESRPPPARGPLGYAIEDVGPWLREYIGRQIPRQSVDPDALDKDQEQARKNKAQADRAEMENDVRRGELVEFDDVLAGWEEILIRVKTRALQLPVTAAPLVAELSDPAAIMDILRDLVSEMLDELANGNVPDSQESDE